MSFTLTVVLFFASNYVIVMTEYISFFDKYRFPIILSEIYFCPLIVSTVHTLMVGDCLPETSFRSHKDDTIFIQNLASDPRYFPMNSE